MGTEFCDDPKVLKMAITINIVNDLNATEVQSKKWLKW